MDKDREYVINPRKIKQGPTSYTEVKSDNLAVILPDALSQEALSYLQECETRLEVAIGRLQSVSSNQKRNYIMELTETYDTLMAAIHAAQTDNKAMQCQIPGIYDNARTMPSIENWAKCNPGKTAAIKYIVRELKMNGWQPGLKLSPFLVGAEDHLCSGGTDIIVECDFTEAID